MTSTGQNLFQLISFLSVSAFTLLIKSQQKDYSVKNQGFYWMSVGVKILVSKTMHIFDKGIW